MSNYFSYFLYDQVFVPTVIFLVSDNAASVQADCTHFSFLCQCYNQRSQVSLMNFSQTPSLQSFSFTQSFKFCMSRGALLLSGCLKTSVYYSLQWGYCSSQHLLCFVLKSTGLQRTLLLKLSSTKY